MYKKPTEGWMKHWDFFALDILSLEIGFVLAYLLCGQGTNPFAVDLYRNMALYLGLADALVIMMNDTFHDVLKRGHWLNFLVTLQQTLLVAAMAVAFLFVFKMGQLYSRLTLGVNLVLYFLLSYVTRECQKALLHKRMEKGMSDRALVIVTTSDVAQETVATMLESNYASMNVRGIVVLDKDLTGLEIEGIPVVAAGKNMTEYLCQSWVDEVLIVVSEKYPYPGEVVDALTETGITVHMNLSKISASKGKKQFVEKVGPYTVLTTVMNYAPAVQLMCKRVMDIICGLVGCLFTGVIFLFVAPAIYIASPGPIFFAQTRVGKNGRTFKMYKFRSMYLDAEARKAELMKDNKLGDGKMFKLDFDPRVIGNKILPDGTKKTGVGDFIRRTSLDEFPQFFNVLKGDMSVVGTRPPLPSETALYEPRHRTRLAIKPGITGMWQVSGRSDITDFEEVVRLDREYIENWNLGLDIKILLKTILVVFKKDGSM